MCTVNSHAMFADVRLFHEMHAVHHLQSLSIKEPRGIGFETEPVNASDYIMSGVSGETTQQPRAGSRRVACRACLCECRRQAKSSGLLQRGTGLPDQRGASPAGASPTWLGKGRALLPGPRCPAASRSNTAADGRCALAGNYEKSLENSSAAVKEYTRGATGNSAYRGISADIISGAYADVVDYTGTREHASAARTADAQPIRPLCRSHDGTAVLYSSSTCIVPRRYLIGPAHAPPGITKADGTKEHTMYEDPRVAAYAAAQAAAGKA